MANYKLLGGTHTDKDEDGNPVTYTFTPDHDTVFTSEEDDLDKRFIAHIEKVGDGPASAKKSKKSAAKKAEPAEPPPGDDVTADFDGAAEAGFLVHKDGRNYCVYDADDPSECLHEEEFTRKDQVNDFVTDNTK